MIKTHEVYYPLYENKDKFIILVTGGRSSGKSFSLGTFIERLTFDTGKDDKGNIIPHYILYTRYTMVSADISVIPEFREKLEADGVEKYFKKRGNDMINKSTGAHVMFRGIKTSSGNQTAKLKSIHGLTTLVVDEAEEWTSEEEFEKIMLSIRKKGIQNRIIIIMNPTDSNHFIYQRYIKDMHKTVEYDGVPVQISTHPNVLHIHTSYLDNIRHCGEEFIREVQEMKEKSPEKYAHTVMGRWADVAEGAIFKKWGIVDEFPEECKKVAIGIDWGYTNDVTSFVKCGIVDNRLYLHELCYRTHMGNADIIKELRKHGLHCYADSADPRLIDEIALGGVIIYPVQKGGGSIMAGIEKMLDMEIYVTKDSYNLQDELRNYTWAKDKNGRYINEPIDAFNHACFTQGTLVVTDRGEKPITQVVTGDKVLNSDGWHKVVRTFDNGVKRVATYEMLTVNGERVSVRCTPDHKVKAAMGWKCISKLQSGDSIFLLKDLATPVSLVGMAQYDYAMERVYNIEVEDVHEYLANGLLVSNCDAARYYVLAVLLGKVMHPKNVTKDDLGIF